MSTARGSGNGSGATSTAHDGPTQPLDAQSDSGSGSGTGSGSGSCSLYNRVVQFNSPSSVNVSESGMCAPSSVTLAVYVVNPSPNCPAISVNYATQNGSATAGIDYKYQSGTLGFSPGQSSPDYITIPILDDGTDEAVGSEYFTVSLSYPVNAVLGSPSAITVNIAEGPQQKAGDTLRWNPCPGSDYLASNPTNWYDISQNPGFQLEAGAPGLKLNPPIQFDANPNDTPNSNSQIIWDQKATVASITLNQYFGQQTINSGVNVESKGASGTALSMDGGSKLILLFNDSDSVFQVDNNATITNMALAGNVTAQFVINGGTTTIGLQSSGASYTDTISVQFNINDGATLTDLSYNALTFRSNGAAINVYGTMNVAFGTGAGATLIQEFANNVINVNGGTLKYLGAGDVKDIFEAPVYVQNGGTFRVTLSSVAQNSGGYLIVKDLSGYKFPNGSLESVYVTGPGSSVQLAYGDTLECDQDFYLDHGTLETTDTSTCTLLDGAQGGGTATIAVGGIIWIAYDPDTVQYGELDVKAATLQFGGQLFLNVAGYDPTKQNQGQQDVLKVLGGTFNLNPQASTLLSVGLNGTLVSGDTWTIISSSNITSSTNTVNFGTMVNSLSTNNLTGAANPPKKQGQYVLSYST